MAERNRAKRVQYDLLHKMCSAEYMYDELKTKRRRKTKILGVYDAERVIAQRKNEMVSNIKVRS